MWEQARAMLQQCLEGEGFYLQIDSHMRFVEDWDALLLKVRVHGSLDTSFAFVHAVGKMGRTAKCAGSADERR